MRISAIEPILVALPYDHGAPKRPSTPTHSWDRVNILFTRVETDDGLVGWGEAFAISCGAVTAKAVSDYVAPLALGRTFTRASALSDELRRAANSVARAGGPVAFALSALDIALWDIEGKVAGRPIWGLLGGEARAEIPAYASLFRIDDPLHVAKVCAAAASRGFRSIKLHEHRVEAVAAARAAVGPMVDIMVDVNCHWTSIADVVAFCDGIAAHHVAWLEEPLFPSDDHAAHAALRRRVRTPIAVGENIGNLMDLRAFLAAGGADIVQLSPAKMGGVTELWRAAALAREAGVLFVPHSPFHGPALLAAIHVIAALGGDIPCELRYCDLQANPISPFGVGRNGALAVPTAPGLGVEIDLDVIDKYRVL